MPGKQSKQNCSKQNKKNQKSLKVINNYSTNTDNKLNNNVVKVNSVVKINSGIKPIENRVINITLAGYCAVCWNNALYYCSGCQIVGYCCLSHMAKHWNKHQNLCCAVTKIIESTGFLYGPKISNADEWRYLRIKTLENIKILLQRNIEPCERDLLLFPKHCSVCYETNMKKLETCKNCQQVWYCSNKPDHIPKKHAAWCKKLQLFSTLVQKQARGKLYMYDMNFGSIKIEQLHLNTNDNIEKAVKQVVKDSDELDECEIAMISQASSGPLTMLYAIRILNFNVKNTLIIHLIGAELHYEGNTLQAWESFFMHFLSEITNLKIIMVGPELNATSNCETIRLCEICRKLNKTLSFEYKDGLLYHEYSTSKSFIKPDIVCAFNPGLHRCTGFNQDDTWPLTIKSAIYNNCPFVFTAYTAYEAPLDLKRVQECAKVNVIYSAKINPFASLKPDRNFISDHEAPLIFKNYYLSIVSPAI